jgi:hypothetical protein
MLGDDRLNSRVRGWLVVGRRRPSSHYRCVAFQISNLSVDVLFSADGHFPTSRIQSGPNRSAARSADSEFGASRRYPDCPQFGDGCHAWVEPSTSLGRRYDGPFADDVSLETMTMPKPDPKGVYLLTVE